MFTFLVIVTVFVFIALVLTSGVKPSRSLYSLSELQRRAKDSGAIRAELRREKSLPAIQALLATIATVLLVLTVILLIITFGWVLGIIVAILVAVFYTPLARTRRLSDLANSLYGKIEAGLLNFVRDFPRVFAFLSENNEDEIRKVDSKQELQELIEHSGEALTDIERKVIVNALDFNEKPVSSVMMPRNTIDTIKKGEFLGPLVLDELHALGRSRLPVIDEDLDHVVGILHLNDMLSLDIKRSTTAEKAMEAKVHYIRKDDTLERALAVCLKTHQHLLIVTDDESKTVGLITLEDIVEALLGRRIVDEAQAIA